ncbi:tetratricopeptide repeat protein [Actinokineospora spheciospongiae]|uniref:tetratricopeptide repeat protein n=1 Tax=Actinokineospora spheciospongiae TaxID=909613 RepID=UPI000D8B973E|nr:tetratricopeptide repeat protein [Actinokineospora spheciospongiae]PWW67114.1 hypothetical protein DFQ13_101632 [Actinokineospora spheciospongiae]
MDWVAAGVVVGSGVVAALVGAAGLVRRRARGARRVAARERVLERLRPDGPASPLRVLTAPGSATRLWGCRRERRELVEWCVGGGPAVRVLGGPAGVGKSRLALAVAEALPRAWSSGWLRRVEGLAEVVRGPALVLVDDADLRSDLPALLEAVRRGPAALRVLLIARDAPRLRDSLRTRGFADLLDADPLVLKPFGGTTDRIRWYTDAARAYAGVLGRALPPFGTAAVGADGDTVFLVHARALLAVVHRSDPRSATPRDVAAELLTLETARWRGAPVGDPDLLAAVATLALVPAPDQYRAVIALRALPRFADRPTAELYPLVDWAWQRHPPGPDHRLDIRPRLVAAWLLARHLTEPAVTGLPEDSATPVFLTLTRTYQEFPEFLPLLAHAFTANQALLGPALRAVFTLLSQDAAVDSALAAVVRGSAHPVDVTAEEAPAGFPRVRLALAVRRIHGLLARADTDRASAARAWDVVGTQWRVLGNATSAVVAHRKALALWRGARERADTVLGVAGSLNSISNCLLDLGDPEAALTAAQDAVGVLERGADVPGSAALLWWVRATLVDRLRHLGRYDEAVAVARPEITGRRAATPEDRLRLAGDLDSLSVSLDFAGKPDEAVDTGRAAVALLRGQDDAGHLEALATVLTSLSDRLDKLGRPDEALTAVEEALRHRRRLPDGIPNGIPDLATTLLAVADRLCAAGRPGEALPVVDEALGHFRVLVALDRRAHLRGLGTALTVRAECLRRTERPRDAVAALRAAVEHGREMAEDNRSRALPHLGAWLHALAAHLLATDEDVEAFKVVEESIAVHRELMDTNPTATIGLLAAALRTCAHCLDRLDRPAEALTALRRSVALWREAAQAHGEVHGENYQAALADLRHHLDAAHRDPKRAYQIRGSL